MGLQLIGLVLKNGTFKEKFKLKLERGKECHVRRKRLHKSSFVEQLGPFLFDASEHTSSPINC